MFVAILKILYLFLVYEMQNNKTYIQNGAV